MKALTMSATRRRDKVVILTGPAYGAKTSKSLFNFSSFSLAKAITKMLSLLFCKKVCAVVFITGALTAWLFACFDNQVGIATSVMAILPWGIVAVKRDLKKGGNDDAI